MTRKKNKQKKKKKKKKAKKKKKKKKKKNGFGLFRAILQCTAVICRKKNAGVRQSPNPCSNKPDKQQIGKNSQKSKAKPRNTRRDALFDNGERWNALARA